MRANLGCWAALALGCVGDPVGSQTHAIIGGEASAAGQYPAVGALVTELFGQVGPSCSGTLIAPDVVLTAAHCLDDPFQTALPGFTLELDANGAATWVRGAAKVVHPGYAGSWTAGGVGQEDDLGLLFLESPITDVTPQPLPNGPMPLQAGASIVIVGYGKTDPSSMEMGIKYDATSVLGQVGDWEFEVGTTPGMPQDCHGDSGGPALFVSDGVTRVVGVAARLLQAGTTECTTGNVDTRVEAYLDWITEASGVSSPPDVDASAPAGPDGGPGGPGGDGDDAGAGDEGGGCRIAHPGRRDRR